MTHNPAFPLYNSVLHVKIKNINNEWYDVKITKVDEEMVKYVDWDTQSTPAVDDDGKDGDDGDNGDDGDDGDDDDETIGFAEQFDDLSKGTQVSWCPWVQDIETMVIR